MREKQKGKFGVSRGLRKRISTYRQSIKKNKPNIKKRLRGI